MPSIILHHYPLSTFSEKVRLALGLKGLDYEEVITPPAMPKPDLLPLTGGYRRAPVMQVGADVYCDTQLILQVLEEMAPEPSLFPDGCEGQATALAWWAEQYVFMPALGFVANVNNAMFQPEFIAERKRFGFMLDKADVAPLFERYVQQLAAHLCWFGDMLRDGRPFILGAAPSAADLGIYPSIWFLNKWAGDEAGRLKLAPLQPWVARVAALGHGRPREITGAEALERARGAAPAETGGVVADPSGLVAGSRVSVTPDDTGRDPVEGVLVAADERRVVIRRESAETGAVQVHFPRAGYDVKRL